MTRLLVVGSTLAMMLAGVSVAHAGPSSQTKTFEAQSSRIKVPLNEVVPVQTAALKARFPHIAGVDEDGYVGGIPLRRIETFPITETLKRQVERVVEIQVSNNDIEDLPTEMLFDTSSGEQMLKRAAVSFEVLKRDDTQTQRGTDGMPSVYKATMVFRGVEEYDDVTHYEAVAHYQGEVTGSSGANAAPPISSGNESVVATSVVGTATPVVEAATPVGGASRGEEASSPAVPVGRILAATTTAIVVLCFGVTRNARIAAQGLSGLRTLGYAHIKHTASGYECTIPSWINIPKRIYQEERAVVVPRRGLRDREGSFTVLWRENVLYQGNLSRRVDLAVPSTSTLSFSRRETRSRLVAVATGGAALVILSIVTVSVLNTMLKI